MKMNVRPTMALTCQDVLVGMRELLDSYVDVVVTSPPYNKGIRYSELFHDDLPRDEYLSWTTQWVYEAARILKPDGHFFLNVGSIPRDPWLAFDVATCCRADFVLQNTFHWVKSISIEEDTRGHFQPINSRRYVNDAHEYIFHFTKTGSVPIDRLAIGVPYKDQSNIRRWVSAGRERKRCRGNQWWIPYATRRASKSHPAAFPPELPETCIRLTGLPPCGLRGAVVVLDPFIGEGNTALACVRLGVSCIGFDNDPDYIARALRRVELETGATREHAATEPAIEPSDGDPPG